MKDQRPETNEVFNFDLQEMQKALKGKKKTLPRIKSIEDMDTIICMSVDIRHFNLQSCV